VTNFALCGFFSFMIMHCIPTAYPDGKDYEVLLRGWEKGTRMDGSEKAMTWCKRVTAAVALGVIAVLVWVVMKQNQY
jgi:hypothetical protein